MTSQAPPLSTANASRWTEQVPGICCMS
ncbi:rCG35205 [Rattus norvegicus]|uniref:RCG35205 n=1 Tax=Rattus norvegicus TaxID=10116 RepID=A6HLC0_RAT|nr:rCG35205 [Rattus norvegicus]